MLYQHGHLLLQAKKAHQRSLEDDSEALVSIALSAMALECYVNDLTQQTEHPYHSEGNEAVSLLGFSLRKLEQSKASLLTKLECIHFLSLGHELDRGGTLHQDLTMLIRLRNELVHKKPESTGNWGLAGDEEFEPHKFVKFFADRGVIDRPHPKQPPTWSQYLSDSAVAAWAHNLVVSVIRQLAEELPQGSLCEIQKIITGSYSEI